MEQPRAFSLPLLPPPLLLPLLLLLLLLLQLARPARAASPWPPSAATQGAALAARMDAGSLCHETSANASHPYQGTVDALPQFGIPLQGDHDSPNGVAGGFDNVTAFPTALTLASAWDPELARQFGDAVGAEQRIKGSTVWLAPAVNVGRVPWCGRHWEYMGEEPWLAVPLAEAIIGASQAHNISGCVKHFALNNQEHFRFTVSANADRRSFMELYTPQFRAAVDAGVGSVMCAYNRVNRTWACENAALLSGFLRGALGFGGFVRSDGAALQHTDAPANAGCDQEMPITQHFGPRLCASVDAGNVSAARLREMVARQLTTHFALGMMDARDGDFRNDARDPARTALARMIGAAGAVLLANADGLLPFSAARIKSLVVFGDQWTVVGNGSGHVIPPYIVSPVDGLRAALPGVDVSYGGSDAAAAPALAAAADACLVVAAVTAMEGFDRLTPDEIPDLTLNRDFPYDALVYAVAGANKNTAVAIRCPGACLAPWLADGTVKSALFVGFAGQEAGNSLADVLTGAVNPSGRLTLTWPNSIYETWLSPPGGGAINPAQYPGYDRGNGYPEVDFSEGLFVGYKWYDAELTTPAFAFGHGLSYTSFEYSDLAVVVDAPAPAAAVTVTFNVTNSGSVAGAEVAQLYLSFPAGLGEPPQLLRGFQKTRVLQPGESAAVALALDAPRLSIFDVVPDAWRVPRGVFGVRVGASSRDIRLTAPFTL